MTKNPRNPGSRATRAWLATPFRLTTVAAILASFALQAADAVWTASSGVSPAGATPPWLFYGEPTNSVTLGSGALRVETIGPSARASYFQEFYALIIPTNLVIEARVRFVSGSSTVPARTSAGIYFYPRQGIANYLWIGKDEIFVNSGARFQRGAAANVDTDDLFHDYRIELRGLTNGASFDVFYDGVLTISGSLFADDEDQQPEIAWGDLAYEASGISEWQSFRHNAAPPPMAVQRLVTFSSSEDGTQPTSLILGADGCLYGTTSGSLFTNGTVFKLTPGGALTVLASFDPNGTNGYWPTALAQMPDGTFYGTTRFTENAAGPNRGTVFKLTPAGELTTVARFEEADGFWPENLVRGHDGNLYGTTVNSIFKVTPDGDLTAVTLFAEADQTYPTDRVIHGIDGNLYGTAEVNTSSQAIVFKITPAGNFSALTTFNRANGSQPRALLQASDGALYGAVSGGEPDDYGSIFRLTTNGVLTTLATFSPASGIGPVSLIQGADGNLYGATHSGGPDSVPGDEDGSGTIFRLTLSGELTTLGPLRRMTRDGLYDLVHGPGWSIFGLTQADPHPAGILRLAPVPLIERLHRAAAADVLVWSSFRGGAYQVEHRGSLAASSWTPLPPIIASGTQSALTNSVGAAAAGFYRVRLLP